MDSGKLNRMGWTPKINLNDGIRKTVEEFIEMYK
jgi:dTDP-D-glucose 4,6-dehydratase